MHSYLRNGAQRVGSARIRGRIHHLGGYPGFVLDHTSGWVVGELYGLQDPSILKALDAYEGIGPDETEPYEYRRIQCPVLLASEEQTWAWVYEYLGSTEGRPQILSGDFMHPD